MSELIPESAVLLVISPVSGALVAGFGAALIAGLFVTDRRAAAPRLARWAPQHGCALPVPDLVGAP
jgi:hypothetical protein